MKRKGQMEIFGLAIVFVLFILALLIFLKFSSDPDEDTAEDFMMKQLPTKMLQTMMKTTTSCKEQEVEVLILDVASNLDPTPPDYCNNIDVATQINCGTRNSYQELFGTGNVIGQIFTNSLEFERKDYEFEIKMKNGCEIFARNSTNSCFRANKINAETFYLTSDRGKVEINLRICENVESR